MSTSAPGEVSQATLRQLAEARAPGPVVLSLFLDLDPSRFATPRARSAEITSLVDGAGRRIDEQPKSDHKQLRADLERAERYLRDGVYTDRTHGLALYCCSAIDLFEPLQLAYRIDTAAFIDLRPYLEPLTAVPVHDRWCVALIDHRRLRVLRGWPAEPEVVLDVEDDVPQRMKTGGGSYPHAEDHVEWHVEQHLARCSELLMDELRRRPFDQLLVSAPAELRGAIEQRLHDYLRRRLSIFHEADLEQAGIAEVRDVVGGLIERHEERHLEETLERLRAAFAAPGGHAASGLEDVLEALTERRVEVLLYDPALVAPGVECENCGWLGTLPEPGSEGPCPVCDWELTPRENVVEVAVEAAVRQSAEVIPLRDRPELGPHRGIAALLRF